MKADGQNKDEYEAGGEDISRTAGKLLEVDQCPAANALFG
jgi:hypothetical protein